MKIGIIGTGSVGTALITGLTSVGHEVVIGSRDPESNQISDVEMVTQRAAADTVTSLSSHFQAVSSPMSRASGI